MTILLGTIIDKRCVVQLLKFTNSLIGPDGVALQGGPRICPPSNVLSGLWLSHVQGFIAIFKAPRLFILSKADWYSSSLNTSVTIPVTRIFLLSKYATARGKQNV